MATRGIARDQRRLVALVWKFVRPPLASAALWGSGSTLNLFFQQGPKYTSTDLNRRASGAVSVS